jgi:hypothetical protein
LDIRVINVEKGNLLFNKTKILASEDELKAACKQISASIAESGKVWDRP